MARYFTSDWHFNERRIGDIREGAFNPFFRPFASVQEQNDAIIDGINRNVREDDELYVLGDVALDAEGIGMLERIACRNRTLIIGNYDVDKLDLLRPHFREMRESLDLEVGGIPCHLNHYPARRAAGKFNIVGHIHGLWKVQPDMVNVSVDAWHFRPVSEAEIAYIQNAMRLGKYDENVFVRD